MYINIKLISKNKTSIYSFLKSLIKLLKTNSLKLNSDLGYLNQKTKKKFFTILKSPHVNKTAQEQFHLNLIMKKIRFKSFKLSKFLILLKKLKQNTFSDILIKIEFVINEKNQKLLANNSLNLKNTVLKKNEKLSKNLNYLRLYGYSLKSLDSSVGRAKD